MNIVMIGAVAGGISGAVGFFFASKVHGDEKGNQLYPIYAVTIFAALVLTSKLLPF